MPNPPRVGLGPPTQSRIRLISDITKTFVSCLLASHHFYLSMTVCHCGLEFVGSIINSPSSTIRTTADWPSLLICKYLSKLLIVLTICLTRYRNLSTWHFTAAQYKKQKPCVVSGFQNCTEKYGIRRRRLSNATSSTESSRKFSTHFELNIFFYCKCTSKVT